MAAQLPETISFIIDSFDSATNLTYQGDAHVPQGFTFLRLTKTDASGYPQGGSVGRVLYSTPFLLWDPTRKASFDTTIKFFIKPHNDIPADGLAFFIAPINSSIPPDGSGGNLGIYDASGTSSVVAVEFDTFINAWDPTNPHIGINIKSRESESYTPFDHALGQLVTAHIKYDAASKVISVDATCGSQSFMVSLGCDLGNQLPERVQVGISASTGDDVSLHDVVYWSFTSTLPAA